MPPQTVPAALWSRIDDKVRYTLETYSETLTLLTGVSFAEKQIPFVYGALSLLIEAIASPFSEDEIAQILTTQEVRFGQPQMWRAVMRIECEMERHYSAKLDPETLATFPSFKSASALVESEISLWGGWIEKLQTTPGKRFLVVGDGPLPVTALLMHKKANIPIVCLETNKKDAACAQRFLDRGGIGKESIEIRYANPATYDYAEHPALLILETVPDKNALLKRAREQDPTRPIAIRAGVGLNTLLYEPLEDQLDARLFLSFDRRTTSLPGCLKSTYFTSEPEETLVFEKEEPKPDLSDVKYFPHASADLG